MGRTILNDNKLSFFGGFPLDVQRWRRDGFRDDGIEAVFVQAVKVLGWNNKGDVAVKRLPLVLQFKLTPARNRCHGRGTMIVSKVFSLASHGRDFLLRWRFIEIDLHPRL